MKWLIPDPPEPEKSQAYWEKIHVEDNYENVLSLTDDPWIIDKIIEQLDQSHSRKILVPGCGSRTNLQKQIVESFPGAQVTCTDYPQVVEIAAEKFTHPRVTYSAVDSTQMPWTDHFDAVVIVNSIVSDSDQTNRLIIQNCHQALRPNGQMIAFFPDIFASLDIATIINDQDRFRKINLKKSTFFEEAQNTYQVFYTPLRLRAILKEADFSVDRFETVFLDSEYFQQTGKDKVKFAVDDPDLVIYENFIVARKI
jgi:2-polyprenyl-3-methyl-5-hydroxy-6-metoxy-1,4-benzoquinol methylase